jgi:hypothetical protein
MVQQALADIPKQMAARKADEADRRCLRGKYAPESWPCGICGEKVVADVRFPHSDRIGGPPLSAYVHHWYCSGCGLMYHKPPKAP